MRYLIITDEIYNPFLTDVFNIENNWIEDIGMKVFDLKLCKYTDNGIDWNDIEIDKY
jgi:hypothetical protein